jgi:predicted PurR-regulated permease PerM
MTLIAQTSSRRTIDWGRRRDILAVWVLSFIVTGVILWLATLFIRSLLVVLIAAVLAYALTPAVNFLTRAMPRFLSITIVYLLVIGGLGTIAFFAGQTAVQQLQSLITSLQGGKLSALLNTMQRWGINNEQIQQLRQQVLQAIQPLAADALPFFINTVSFIFDGLIVLILSIYLVVDGQRLITWLRTQVPLAQREQAFFGLDALEQVVGGYIRGQLTMALLIGVLVGFGMFVLQVPYAILLGMLAFVLEFIPVIGTLVSGVICCVLALTQGVALAGIVLAYFVVVHIIEGDVVGPRIVGKAIGVHPAVSLVALVAGSELFGIWGALFAAPAAGLVQAVLSALWIEWRSAHPEKFTPR